MSTAKRTPANERHARPNRAVGSQSYEVKGALNDYPTPPWATRALLAHVLSPLGMGTASARIWEPAAGRGIMAGVLREVSHNVFASDVHRYENPRSEINAIGSFVGEGADVLARPRIGRSRAGERFDYLITNPPFSLAAEFFARAIEEADVVALLCRSNWSEGVDRYRRIFSRTPPLAVAQFVERVPMVRGRFDPDATTLTAYSWFVWLRGSSVHTRFMFIPPCRSMLTRANDAALYAEGKGQLI